MVIRREKRSKVIQDILARPISSERIDVISHADARKMYNKMSDIKDYPFEYYRDYAIVNGCCELLLRDGSKIAIIKQNEHRCTYRLLSYVNL